MDAQSYLECENTATVFSFANPFPFASPLAMLCPGAFQMDPRYGVQLPTSRGFPSLPQVENSIVVA